MSSRENCMNEQYIDFLAEELAREKLVIFVGAGVSRNSGLPSWQELVEVFAKKLGLYQKTFSSEEMLAIPEKFYREFGKVPYYRILHKIFEEKEYYANEIHNILKDLNLNYIITTNYDKLLDKIYEGIDEYYDVIKEDKDLAYSNSNKMIIKMHGDIEKKNVVLKKSDYDNYEKNFPLITTFIKGLFTTNTILFIGYSLNDINVKNIMKWISEILGDDFRKVYLVNLVDKNTTINFLSIKKNEENLINTITLEVKNNHKEILIDFLNKLYKNKQLKEENKYEVLSYLTNSILKKILLTFSSESFDFSNEGILIKKEINQENKYLITEEEKKIIESIITFSFDKYNINSKDEVKNKLLLASKFALFQEYDEAITLVEQLNNISDFEKKRNQINFLKSFYSKEKIRKNFIKDSIKNSEIDNFYQNYLKKSGYILMNELEEYLKTMDFYLDEIRLKRISIYFGETPLKKSRFLIKDLFNFIIYNGLAINSVQFLRIIKKYIEILFIAFSNKINTSNIEEVNSLEKFDYLDLYFMILTNNEELNLLLKQHKIDKFICEENCNLLLIESFKHVINLIFLEEKNSKTNLLKQDFINILINIIFILSKCELEENEIQKIFDLLFEEKTKIAWDIPINIYFKDFFSLLIKYQNLLNEKRVKQLISMLAFNEEKNLINDEVINFIVNFYEINNINKINDQIILEKLENKCSFSSKIKLLKIVEKNIQAKKIQIYQDFLSKKFDFKLYRELLLNNLMEANEKMEKELILLFTEMTSKKITSENMKDIIEIEELIRSIFNLVIENKITQWLKTELHTLKNIYMEDFIEQNSYSNIWNYILYKEKYNFNEFRKEDLKLFTKIGIDKILHEGKEYQDFMKMISSYSKKNNDYISEAYIEFLEEQLNTKGDQ